MLEISAMQALPVECVFPNDDYIAHLGRVGHFADPHQKIGRLRPAFEAHGFPFSGLVVKLLAAAELQTAIDEIIDSAEKGRPRGRGMLSNTPFICRCQSRYQSRKFSVLKTVKTPSHWLWFELPVLRRKRFYIAPVFRRLKSLGGFTLRQAIQGP